MMPRRFARCSLLLLVGAFWRIGSPVARAALVQPPESERVAVSHRVELSPFAAAEDGEVIALELHQDPDCSAAVGPTTFPVASAARLLAEPVSGRSAADTASSVGRAIRLRYPMEPARVPRRLYLRANGSHVTPFRVECQPQAASVREDRPTPGRGSRAPTARGRSGAEPTPNGAARVAMRRGVSRARSSLRRSPVWRLCPRRRPPARMASAAPPADTRASTGDDAVLASQPNDATGWFCSVAGGAASEMCEAACGTLLVERSAR